MRRASRQALPIPAIEALNQQHLIGPLLILIKPLMPRIRQNRPREIAIQRRRLTRVDDLRLDEVGLGDGMRGGDGEWVFVDCRDGPPEVDNLPALCASEDCVGESGEVLSEDEFRARVGLVDVHAVEGPLFGGVAHAEGVPVCGAAADEVSEDVCRGAAGSGLLAGFGEVLSELKL